MDSANKPLEDLREIRNLMERSTRFLSLSGLSGISAGIFALLGAAFAFFILDYDQRYFDSNAYFTEKPYHQSNFVPYLVIDGALVLIGALLTSFYYTYRRAKKNGLSLWDNTTRRMITAMSIPLITGGIFCLLLIMHQLVFLVSPVTLIFYGLSLVAASQFTLPEIKFLGICELILGLLAAVLTGYGLLFWSLGFGLLHIIYGFRMYFKYER
jgi:hypothetical protein